MKYCVQCGSIVEGDRDRCGKCSVDSESIESQTNTGSDEGGDAPKLFSEVVDARKAEEKAVAKQAKRDALQAKFDDLKARISSVRDSFLARRKVTFPIAGIVVLASAWGIGQNVVYSATGPDQIVSRYLNVVNSADWNSLKDPTLFKQVGQYVAAPEVVMKARSTASTSKLNQIVRDGLNANISLTLNGVEYSITAQASMEFTGLFWTPTWTIVSPSPWLDVSFDSFFDPSQKVTAGSFSGTLDEVAENVGQSFRVLPGEYTFKVLPAGFLGLSTGAKTVTSGNQSLFVEHGRTNINAISDAVEGKITKAAKTCFKKKCKALGKWHGYDFSFWDWYPYEEYSSSKFRWKGKFSSCDTVNYDLSSITEVYAYAPCHGDIKAHMYIKYVYFSSWYYSRWWYWNYDDSRSTDVYTSVKITTTLDSSKYKIGKVKVQGNGR